MKIAIFHELNKYSGARKVVDEYGKILTTENVVDLYYVDEKEDLGIIPFFTNVYFSKFTEKKWKGNNFKVKLYKDTIERIKLYFLHKKIAKIINSKKYDLILVNPSKFTQAPYLLRFLTKSVYFCQEPLRIIYDDLLNKQEVKSLKGIYERVNRSIRKEIDKTNIKSAQLVLANSDFSKTNIKKAYGMTSVVCYLGVDEEIYFPTNTEKTYDIFFTGEKEWLEGYDLFKETLNLYDKKPKVIFGGRDVGNNGVSEKEMATQYNKAKIAVCLSRNEPFGLTPLEAMACGVPVVAVNEGGLKESVVDGKTGFLINRDAKELKKKIDLLLKDDKLRKNYSKSARKYVLSKFTWETSVKNLIKAVGSY